MLIKVKRDFYDKEHDKELRKVGQVLQYHDEERVKFLIKKGAVAPIEVIEVGKVVEEVEEPKKSKKPKKPKKEDK